MTATVRIEGRFRLLFTGSGHAVRGMAVGHYSQLTHHLDRLKLRWHKSAMAGGIGLGPWTSEELKVFQAWAEPLRTDDPCTLFDCHPQPSSHRPHLRPPRDGRLRA